MMVSGFNESSFLCPEHAVDPLPVICPVLQDPDALDFMGPHVSPDGRWSFYNKPTLLGINGRFRNNGCHCEDALSAKSEPFSRWETPFFCVTIPVSYNSVPANTREDEQGAALGGQVAALWLFFT